MTAGVERATEEERRGVARAGQLASEEYFKSVKPKLLDAPVITPVFEDWKDGRYKIICFMQSARAA